MSNGLTSIDRNKNPILNIIKNHLSIADSVLEIGSGTGEHISFFASNIEGIHWQPSDLSISGININDLKNVSTPVQLDMLNQNWSANIKDHYNIILTINSLHIMPWQGVVNFWNGCKVLKKLEKVIIYGPFKVNGNFKSESDIAFEKWLKSNSILSGLRDISAINDLAKQSGFYLSKNYDMPANNHLLVFIKD